MSNYIIAICGYEGVESIWGPFPKEEAGKLALKWKLGVREITREEIDALDKDAFFLLWQIVHGKEECADYSATSVWEYTEAYDDHFLSSEKANLLEEKQMYDLGLDYFHFSSDQICVMSANEQHRFECVCSEFPEFPEQKVWLM